MDTTKLSLLLLAFISRLAVQALPLNSPLLPSYDFIIVGGGPAGLTVANRLSEDPSTTVLLLEAGPADDGEPIITVPGFIGDAIGGRYDWNLSTVPQAYLNGQPRNIPQGRALGGGTVLNGMLWSRGDQGDYQDWVDLGNPGWGWDDLLPYFKKSERYTAVENPQLAARYSIQEYAPVHGHDGPVNVSFPRYFWDASAVLFDALNEVGIPTAYDPNTGLVNGASFLPMDLDPETQERCTARDAYYEPYIDRPNLWVCTGRTVTQILLAGHDPNVAASTPVAGSTSVGNGGSPGIASGIFGITTTLNSTEIGGYGQPDQRSFASRVWRRLKHWINRRQQMQSDFTAIAIGVEYAENAGARRQTVMTNREVIVAAGALHSPQVLMMSGIGRGATLHSQGIPVNVDLPGVGSNLQDHGQVWAWYPYYNVSFPMPTELFLNEQFATDAWIDYWRNRTGPLTTSAIAGVAFPSLPYIVNGSTAIVDAVAAQAPDQYLAGDTDPTVVRGYKLQKRLMTAALRDVTRASYELINANDGVLTVAAMKPFSRGSVTIRSPRPFDPPIIDPRYGSNPADIQVLQAALAFNQRLLSTDSLSKLDPVEIFPAAGATDAQVVSYIKDRWTTEYHPAGTCAMMPLELGGVVSPQLMVHGTRNLRVVDSSIMPLLPAAHLQAVVYGVAEKAADIIKAANGLPIKKPSAPPRPLPPEPSSVAPDTPDLLANASSPPEVVTVYYTRTVTA